MKYTREDRDCMHMHSQDLLKQALDGYFKTGDMPLEEAYALVIVAFGYQDRALNGRGPVDPTEKGPRDVVDMYEERLLKTGGGYLNFICPTDEAYEKHSEQMRLSVDMFHANIDVPRETFIGVADGGAPELDKATRGNTALKLVVDNSKQFD